MLLKMLAAASMAALTIASPAQAAPLTQYASSVSGFSSQFSSSTWSAAQALGAPNTLSYGDVSTAWAPLKQNGTLEDITLGFGTAVYATGATIRETYGNGFVYRVDGVDTSGVLHTLWTGTDTSAAGAPAEFTVNWAATSYLVQGLKIYSNTDHNLNAWEEIDAIQLTGNANPAAVPEPATLAVMGLGLLALVGARRMPGKRKSA